MKTATSIFTSLTLLIVSLPATASAWHGYLEFEHTGDGNQRGWPGGDGILYLGRPGTPLNGPNGIKTGDTGMDCAVCHINPAGSTMATVTFSPPMGPGNSYDPNTVYNVEVLLTRESAGTSGCNRRNTNSLVGYFTDPSGMMRVGQVGGGWSAEMCRPGESQNATRARSGSIVAGTCSYVGGQGENRNMHSSDGGERWRFRWDPQGSSMPVKFWMGLVDGNCTARNGGAQTYEGDDVFMYEEDLAAPSAYHVPAFLDDHQGQQGHRPGYVDDPAIHRRWSELWA